MWLPSKRDCRKLINYTTKSDIYANRGGFGQTLSAGSTYHQHVATLWTVRVYQFLRIAAHKTVWAFRKLLVFPIILYRGLVSPILPGSCIYEPSCSRYMQGSIERFGLLRGLVLGLARVFRCAGGLYTGGDDPVPERFSFAEVGRGYRRFWRRRS